MRNPNGYGGVIRLPGKRREPYLARITVGWEMGVATKGKRKGQVIARQKFRNLGTAKTKREAWAILEANNATPISPKAGNTLKNLYDEWSCSKYPKVSKSMADGYSAAWKYLEMHSKVKLSDLRTSHFQTAIDEAHKKKLSQSSLQKIRALSVQLCTWALKDDIIPKNYALQTEMPIFAKKKVPRFSELHVQTLWNSLHVPWVDSILIMVYTGLRPGEALGLTKFNIDWEQHVITGAGIKSDAGRDKIVPIHPKIAPLLKRLYDLSGDTLISLGGKRISLNYYRKYLYYPVLEKLGLPKLSPHKCRHTFASMMAEAEVDPIYIQQIMGHANYETTADTYTHLAIEKLANAMNKI